MASLTYIVRTPNTPEARRRQLQTAIEEMEAAEVNRAIQAANDATKRALEAVHELFDCAERGEWSRAGWSADDVGLLRAHVGARNASHHTSSSVVALHGGTETPDLSLRWDLSPSAIAGLPSQAQRNEFNARLAGQPVLPEFRKLATRIAASIP